ncbi:hypothetical protein EJB05_01440, partial [Eragrostis curvula]
MTTLTFSARRKEPSLVGPAAPTPRETKRLSDVDDQEVLRKHVSFVSFYHGGSRAEVVEHRDPATVIRRALEAALVPYYPLAGRLREVEGRKLVVDCTGEGVLFVEADADVRLAELEAAGLWAPFPCLDQLLVDVEISSGMLGCPLLFVQVTRLLCGGFVLALRMNHTMFDAMGFAQFMSEVAQQARGLPAAEPAVWSRELLEAPPGLPPPPPTTFVPPRELGDLVLRTFTFGRADVTAIKKRLPPKLRDTATSFEALTAALWRARTAALELPPDRAVRLLVVVNFRRLTELALPAGYYGNACVTTAALTTAAALVVGSLGDAAALVRAAKATVTAEYVRSSLGRPLAARAQAAETFVVTDHRHAGFNRVDVGWGDPVYGGIAKGAVFGSSTLVSVKNADGEDAVGLFIVLPQPAMDRFTSELHMLLASSRPWAN